MTKRRNQPQRFRPAVAALLLSALLGGTVAARTDAAPQDEARLALELHRTKAFAEIQNVMGRRMFYHSIGRNDLELALWSQRQPIRWGQNQGCWVGIDSYRAYYVTHNDKQRAADLKRLAGINPGIRDVPENLGVGTSVLHTLTTPVIEVAGDGESAKAVWYTPGAILMTEDGKTPSGLWIWERYGVDFVHEDGQWRILHLQVNTDFMNPMGKPLQPQPEEAAQMGAEGVDASSRDALQPDIAKTQYHAYSPARPPALFPALPEPYQTLADTFEYADCRAE